MRWPPAAAQVPRDPLFDSPWLKWGRTVIHAQALQADLDAHGPDSPYQPTFAVRADYQPKRHGFAVVIEDIDPMPPTWGLLLGDVANNLRSALDQLAWAIVMRGKTPPAILTDKQQRGIYFPLCETPRQLMKVLPRKLPGATHADITRVRRYQPYKHRAWGDTLPLLAQLNTDDKHRTVQPLWATVLGGTIEITHQRDCIVRERDALPPRQVLKVDTELCLVRARKMGKNPHIEVIPHLTAQPAFSDGTLLRQWLQRVIWWVQWLLYEFSEMPPEIDALGIDTKQVRSIFGWKPPGAAH